MPMPRPNSQRPIVQLDLFRSSSLDGLNWPVLSAEVREKVTRLIARMLSQNALAKLAVRGDGGGRDE
jgi:hypothetical protein